MRVISLLVIAACTCSGAQVIMSGSGSKKGVHFRYETRIEPELPGQKITGFGTGGIIVGTSFHRYMEDSTTKKYFGYDLSIEPQSNGTFRVTFQPLSRSAEKLGLRPAAEWSQLPLPRLPEPQLARSGDTIALDLFVHPGTGQKIVDYLFIQDDRAESVLSGSLTRLQSERTALLARYTPGHPKVVKKDREIKNLRDLLASSRAVRLPSGQSRDYTVDDVPITVSKMRLSVNGKQVDEWGGGMSGTAVYFYLPNHGRFVFSLAPNQELGFRKAGEVRGSTLTITWGKDTFVFDCDGPIAPGGGAFNLYVYHDPTWRPRGGPDTFQLGASSARSLVRRNP